MEEANGFQNFDPEFMTVCCVPGGCHVGEFIHLDRLVDTVKVTCNNEHCMEGDYMHKMCFDEWQETVLTYLRSTGRARSWSEKQRLQNLWTKKGYDLAYKACGCKCGKGHLRKDLDWIPPALPKDDNSKKKKHRKKKNDKPCLTLSRNLNQNKAGQAVPIPRIRSSSISSTSSGSPASYVVPESPQSPFFSGNKPNSSQRERHNSEGIFSRRQDYSSFNMLPRHKINSYHIKMEDERCQGNDEIRGFILCLFSANKTSRISCIFCDNAMSIFDSYPLIDGTFFMSPRQHSVTSLLANTDTHTYYLNAICMTCLEGWNTIYCRYCHRKWNGSELILGTMYSYDVLAAKPCCVEKFQCSNCSEIIRLPENRLLYFSDYSHVVPCPNCGTSDFHFVKPITWYCCS